VGARTEQRVLSASLRNNGASWGKVVAEFRMRWGLNARQTVRISRGMSQGDVARAWCNRWPDDPKTDQNVSTWERWPHKGHMPSLVVLDRLAQVYRCSVADLVSDFDDHGVTGQDVGHDGDVDRRTLMVGIGTSLVASAIPKPQAGATGTRVAPEAADYFQQQLDGHVRADVYIGPHLVIEALTVHYRALTNAIAATTGALHRDLLRIATSYAAIAGWLYQDAGDLASSASWRAETLEMAHRSGDPQLISYALTNQAMLRVEVGDGAGAVDLAEANLANATNLAPKPRVLALAQLAQGRSLIGDRAGVDRALEGLASTLDDVDDDWHWGNACRWTPAYVDAQRATCYGRLGLARESADLWAGAIRLQPESHRRDTGVYLARHATAMLDGGEPAEAARLARRSVVHLHETGSARMRLELARLSDKAKAWSHTSDGRELAGVLSDVV
jgi:tetratricopeptide (TPR) repeat protein